MEHAETPEARGRFILIHAAYQDDWGELVLLMAEIQLTSWGWQSIPLFLRFHTSQVLQESAINSSMVNEESSLSVKVSNFFTLLQVFETETDETDVMTVNLLKLKWQPGVSFGAPKHGHFGWSGNGTNR